MITIVIDHNEDKLRLIDESGNNFVSWIIKDIRQMEKIMIELLNLINKSETQLVRIEDDSNRVIAEWL